MTAPERRPLWEPISVGVAVLSLIAVLIFNTLQVRDTRQATQIGLSTELHALVTASFTSVNRSKIPDKLGGNGALNRREQAALRDLMFTADYLAWLLNQEHMSDEDAEAYWAPLLDQSYQLGLGFPDDLPVQAYAELKRFVDRHR